MSAAKRNGEEEEITMNWNNFIRLVSEGEEQKHTRHRANAAGFEFISGRLQSLELMAWSI